MFKLLLLLSIMFSSVFALDGKVVNVADGDTITILTNDKKRVKVRFYGIDAPEKKQSYSNKSRDFLYSIVADKIVNVKEKNTDRYGRVVGIVYVDGTDVNEKMVENGYAWAYTRYSKNYVPQENKARSKKLGLWQEPNPIEPEKFRKLQRSKK